LKQLYADVNALVTTVTKSGPVQQSLNELQSDAGSEPLRLLRMISTRWNAAFLVMRRVAMLSQQIPVACAMHGKRQNVDFDVLPHVVSMLAAVFESTQRLQADGATIQHCYLEIKNLIAALNSNTSPLRDEARMLAGLIEQRFAYFYKVGTGFDPVYLTACALEPDNFIYLTDTERRTAKSIIMKEVR